MVTMWVERPLTPVLVLPSSSTRYVEPLKRVPFFVDLVARGPWSRGRVRHLSLIALLVSPPLCLAVYLSVSVGRTNRRPSCHRTFDFVRVSQSFVSSFGRRRPHREEESSMGGQCLVAPKRQIFLSASFLFVRAVYRKQSLPIRPISRISATRMNTVHSVPTFRLARSFSGQRSTGRCSGERIAVEFLASGLCRSGHSSIGSTFSFGIAASIRRNLVVLPLSSLLSLSSSSLRPLHASTWFWLSRQEKVFSAGR